MAVKRVNDAVNKALSEKPSVTELAEIRKAVSTCSVGLDRVRAASKCRGVDWHRRWELGPNLLFPEYPSMKRALKLLCAKAILEATEGHPDIALDDLRTASRIAGHCGDDPATIGGLVQFTSDKTVTGAISRVLAIRHDRTTLQAARQLVLDLPDLASIEQIFSGELVFQRMCVQNLVELAEQLDRTDSPVFEGPLERKLIQNRGFRAAMEAACVRYGVDLVEASRIGSDWGAVYKAVKRLDESLASDKSPATRYAAVLMSLWSPVVTARFEAIAYRRALCCGIEALLVREATGNFPRAVTSTTEMTIDPFTLKPLRLTVTGGELRIYSLGSDLVDDFGRDRREAGLAGLHTHDLVRSFK